jgi:hypothetical protein
MYVCMYVCMYICTYRERTKDRAIRRQARIKSHDKPYDKPWYAFVYTAICTNADLRTCLPANLLIGGNAAAHDDAVEVGKRRVSAAQLDCARHSVLQMPDGHVLRSGETRKEGCTRGAEEFKNKIEKLKKKSEGEFKWGGCPSSRGGTGNGKTQDAEVRGWTRTARKIRGNVEFVRRSLGRGAGVQSERDTCQDE